MGLAYVMPEAAEKKKGRKMKSFDEEKMNGEGAMSLTRRSFLKKGATVGAAGAMVALGGTALTGCQPSGSSAPTSSAEAMNGAVDEHIPAGRRATATLENAEPIPPENPPAEWTAEADVVIVGTGGGGLAAALLARDQGASVIVVEKQDAPGGASQHVNGWVNIAGTGTWQKEMKYSTPEFPYDRDTFLRFIEKDYQFTINDDLLGNMAETAGECIDWMLGKGADLTGGRGGMFYQPTPVAKNEQHKCMSFKVVTDQFAELGEKAGAEFHYNAPCTALITENDRVVGIKAKSADGDVYFKANKGVILCSGGIGMNPDMLKKYIPTAYEVAVTGGPMPYHTGECTRMALGVGADMAGYDSWCGWESEMDNDTGQWNYFWSARQITQMPWLNIDIRGKRCNFYEWGAGEKSYQAELPFAQAGQDRARAQVQASRIGHRAYAIFDGKFEDYMWNIANPPLAERRPITIEDPVVKQDLFNVDWHVEFEKALDDGRMKQADTLEELAEELGMDPQVLNDSIDQWNKNCESGVDSGTIYPLPKEFLNPILEPPFYGAKLGVIIGKTLCGLRVDEDLRVLNAKGQVIPGLYANFTTAGGICGESTYGTSLVNTSILGGLALTWTSGYHAAKVALSDK